MKPRKLKRIRRKPRNRKYETGGLQNLALQVGTTLNTSAYNGNDYMNAGKAGIGTALQFGSAGMAFGPVGGLIGAGIGAIAGGLKAKGFNKGVDERIAAEYTNKKLLEEQYSRGVLADYNTAGSNTNTSFYKNGGIQRPINGGVETSLANGVVRVDGKTHEQGGIQVPGATVEDNEVGFKTPEGTVWFSDTLKNSEGKTFAEIADKIGKMKGNAEEKLTGDKYSRNTGLRETEKAYSKLKKLTEEQYNEQIKRGLNPYGNYAQYGTVTGGPDKFPPYDKTVVGFGDLIGSDYPLNFRPNAPNLIQPTNETYQAPTPDLVTTTQRNRGIKDLLNIPSRTVQQGKKDARFYNRNAKYDTNQDGIISEEEKTLMRSAKQAKTVNSINKFAEQTSGMLDNVTNAILIAKSPNIPQPQIERAVPLQTKFDIGAPLAEIRRNVRTTGESIRRSTGNSAQYRNQLLAAQASGINASNQLYTDKTNKEVALQNRNRLNVQQVGNRNIKRYDQYTAAKFQRESDIQSRISSNVANLVEDIRLEQLQSNKQRIDAQTIAIMRKRFADTGVLNQVMEGYFTELENGTITPEEFFIKIAEEGAKKKQ